ncbi:uncharacterized protein y4hQ [Trichonephila clavata]|uniref:Uncharacterized protein y4hQ n=1 Tax=Trichonephila clavata TaxID=2740835 RepID=A0A8X6LGA8_TRICU|nr:uncharacterized protein y4hQ [Trichonephila clavata]
MSSNDSLVYQFKISLKCIKPNIWRRIQVPASYTFRQLHYAIQDSMGWKSGLGDYHLHTFIFRPFRSGSMFEIGPPSGLDYDVHEIIPEKVTKIAEFCKVGKKATYMYDFGDDWGHDVVLEKILPAVEGCTYPRCIKGKRACPPEDCGGYEGYDEHIAIIRNSKHPEYESHCKWVEKQNASLNPEEFDPAAVKFYEGDASKMF